MVKLAQQERRKQSVIALPTWLRPKGSLAGAFAPEARDESESEMELDEEWENEENVDEDVEVDNGNFPGASAACRERTALHQCDWCNDKQPLYSHMCYVDRRTKEFAEKLDQVYMQVVHTQDYIRKFDTSEVDFVCIHCKGLQDGKQYLKAMKSDPSRMTPTAEWNKKRNKSSGRMTKSQLQYLLTRWESKKGQTYLDGRRAMEVYEARKNLDFGKGSDWVSNIGPDVFLLYGCSQCHIYPLKSSDFLRTAKMSAQDTDLNIHNAMGNEWRVPCCGAKWTWREQGRYRLLVLGGNPDSAQIKDRKYVYIGDGFGQKLENTVEFLKGCQLLKTLAGCPITKNNILDVIEELNDLAESRLMTLPEVTQIKVINPKNLDNYEHRFRIVCQDKRLSVPFAGKIIRVVDLKKGSPQAPKVVSAAELNLLVSICAATLDLEAAAKTPAEKKMVQDFKADKTFKCARLALVRMNAPEQQLRLRSATAR